METHTAVNEREANKCIKVSFKKEEQRERSKMMKATKRMKGAKRRRVEMNTIRPNGSEKSH